MEIEYSDLIRNRLRSLHKALVEGTPKQCEERIKALFSIVSQTTMTELLSVRVSAEVYSDNEGVLDYLQFVLNDNPNNVSVQEKMKLVRSYGARETENTSSFPAFFNRLTDASHTLTRENAQALANRTMTSASSLALAAAERVGYAFLFFKPTLGKRRLNATIDTPTFVEEKKQLDDDNVPSLD